MCLFLFVLDRSNFSSLYFSTQYLFSQAPGVLGTALRALWGKLNTQNSQALSFSRYNVICVRQAENSQASCTEFAREREKHVPLSWEEISVLMSFSMRKQLFRVCMEEAVIHY